MDRSVYFFIDSKPFVRTTVTRHNDVPGPIAACKPKSNLFPNKLLVRGSNHRYIMSGIGAPPAVNTGNFELNGEIQLEMSRMSDKLKILLPFAVLLLLKYLLDNFLIGLALLLNVFVLYRIQKSFSLQLSLKDRSSKSALLALLVSVTGLVSFDLYVMNAYFEQDNVLDRLALVYPKPGSSLSFLSIVWYCLVTDGILQMAALSLKLVVCIVVSSRHFFCARCKVSSCITMQAPAESPRPHNHEDDIERLIVTEGIHVPQAHSSSSIPFGEAMGYSTLSALTNLGLNTISSSLTGLVRRPVPLSSSAIHQLSAESDHDGNGTSITQSSIGDDSTTNSSDYDANDIRPSTESSDYLFRLRLCSLIDMLCLLYRSVVPVPVWSFYFHSGQVFAAGLTWVYILSKVLDLSWKTKGLVEAVQIYFISKIVSFRLSRH